MIVEKLIEKLSIRSSFVKLILGSTLIALIIALGMIGILRLFGFWVSPVIPVALAVVGAAIYAARIQKGERTSP